jgi:ribonuclease-3
MVSKKKIFHYDIYEDNGIDGTLLWVKLSIDGKVIQKPELPQKKRRKKHHNAIFCITEKNGQKIISYSSKLHRFRS